MKYYIIAGEASGDLHGSNLIKEIIKLDPEAIVRGWGGDKMKSAGAEIIKHFKELSFMGFYEVFINLKTILKNIKFCKKDILKFKAFIRKQGRMVNDLNARIKRIRFDKKMGGDEKATRIDRLYQLRNDLLTRVAKTPAFR